MKSYKYRIIILFENCYNKKVTGYAERDCSAYPVIRHSPLKNPIPGNYFSARAIVFISGGAGWSFGFRFFIDCMKSKSFWLLSAIFSSN